MHVDESYFLDGISRKEVPAAFGANIIFDGRKIHTETASEAVASAVVPYREGDEPAKK